MKRRLLEHLLSVVVVAAAFAFLILQIQTSERSHRAQVDPDVEQALELSFLDFGDPLDRALFRESLDARQPADSTRHRALVERIIEARRRQFTDEQYKAGAEERGITTAKLGRILGMYLQFIVVYVVVMIVTIYAAETLGVYRFVRWKQGRLSSLTELAAVIRDPALAAGRKVRQVSGLFLAALARGVLAMILFSPAYVIAYSMKTRFDTDSLPFMIGLGIISNGLLASYTHKFYTFLVAESRKGYVETAVVKNLSASYSISSVNGIPLGRIVQFRKSFPGHVFQHIFLNARHQFIPTFKEHASFVITGLVIIEMALNIQGHLSYEMLKNILSKQHDVVLVIVFAIYLLVKATEVVVDLIVEREAHRLENRTIASVRKP
ncbi:MAG TPA: hypothetical protein VNL69_05005 [Bacteroidota bacterium]|nr:hypothetical protein [Bacteroidota bacterium]